MDIGADKRRSNFFTHRSTGIDTGSMDGGIGMDSLFHPIDYFTLILIFFPFVLFLQTLQPTIRTMRPPMATAISVTGIVFMPRPRLLKGFPAPRDPPPPWVPPAAAPVATPPNPLLPVEL